MSSLQIPDLEEVPVRYALDRICDVQLSHRDATKFNLFCTGMGMPVGCSLISSGAICLAVESTLKSRVHDTKTGFIVGPILGSRQSRCYPNVVRIRAS